MSPSDHPFHLWIATDDTQTVAALAPLKVTRSPLKHEWGSMTDLRALPPTRNSPNIGGLIVLVALVPLVTATLWLLGAPPLGILVLAVLVLGFGSATLLPKDPPSYVVAPDLDEFPDIHRVLESSEDREDFLDLVELAEQAGRTLPALEGQVDLADAGQSLAMALWEGADILSRRVPLRLQMSRRTRQPQSAETATSAAAGYLAEQHEKVKTLWDQTNDELIRIRTLLEVAAVAGENTVHDPMAIMAARDAYRELASLYGDRF